MKKVSEEKKELESVQDQVRCLLFATIGSIRFSYSSDLLSVYEYISFTVYIINFYAIYTCTQKF